MGDEARVWAQTRGVRTAPRGGGKPLRGLVERGKGSWFLSPWRRPCGGETLGGPARGNVGSCSGGVGANLAGALQIGFFDPQPQIV